MAKRIGKRSPVGRGDSASLIRCLLLCWGVSLCSGVFRCGPHEDHLNGKRCCTLCPPGLGVITPCSPDNNTVCQACIAGKTFSPYYSHIDICRPCRQCQVHSHMTHVCNVTHDTVCQCDWNYFYDVVTRTCQPCSVCLAGFGILRACNRTENTECIQCPPGTFSDHMTALGGCVVCRICGTHQVSLQACSYQQNTVCVDLPPVRSTLASALSTVWSDDASYSQTNVIPFYCAILAAVVVGLVIYVIIKHCRNHKQKQTGVVLTYVAVATGADCVTHKQSSDSGVGLEQDTKSVTGSTRLRDVPAVRRRALETLLSNSADDSWKRLAKRLGFSATRTASFERRALAEGHVPSRYMLCEWSKCRSATVTALVAALTNIGRTDLVTFIYAEPIYTASGKHRVPPLHAV